MSSRALISKSWRKLSTGDCKFKLADTPRLPVKGIGPPLGEPQPLAEELLGAQADEEEEHEEEQRAGEVEEELLETGADKEEELLEAGADEEEEPLAVGADEEEELYWRQDQMRRSCLCLSLAVCRLSVLA